MRRRRRRRRRRGRGRGRGKEKGGLILLLIGFGIGIGFGEPLGGGEDGVFFLWLLLLVEVVEGGDAAAEGRRKGRKVFVVECEGCEGAKVGGGALFDDAGAQRAVACCLVEAGPGQGVRDGHGGGHLEFIMYINIHI